MDRPDALEATPILQRSLRALLTAAPTRGRPGSDLRSACGSLTANAEVLIAMDQAGPPLANCFDLATKAGATQKQLSYVRSTMMEETPKTVGAVLITNAIIRLCLSSEGRVIAGMTFVTRTDVDQLKQLMNEAFAAAEETAADAMDAMTYQALVQLHAAVTAYLVETARPLPRLIRFQFAAPMPTLQIAQRLYYDASRADELRAENHVVHPAFAPATGRALSA
jgi:prophage DNA circulation protein